MLHFKPVVTKVTDMKIEFPFDYRFRVSRRQKNVFATVLASERSNMLEIGVIPCMQPVTDDESALFT